MRGLSYLSIIMVGVVACSSEEVAITEESPGLAARAAVDGATAQRTALGRVPGDVEGAALRVEQDRLVYVFAIETEGSEGIEEVVVDAMNGGVLATRHEDEEDEESDEADEAPASLSGEVTTIVERPELRGLVTVSDADARRAALSRIPGGKIVQAELEEEDGKLIYSFDIRVEGQAGIEEVHVDARTGLVISQEHETSD
jgi:uncharacterized membrane protein YkoI